MNNNPKVAVIREEGSNGEREMIAGFYLAGFDTYDVTMSDIIVATSDPLQPYQGLVFVGGFSYSDTFGGGKGWASSIKHNEKLIKWFDDFYNRNDTFSFGVCNGCQLMALLNWIPKCKIVENNSKRFESRFPTVKVFKSPAIMLKNMDESILGVWIAHGEGKIELEGEMEYDTHLAPIRYVDDNYQPTEVYPLNPNGSQYGITALCSENGRHLAMMPHPERTFKMWQMPYTGNLKKFDNYSPWFMLFQNAYLWCREKNENSNNQCI